MPKKNLIGGEWRGSDDVMEVRFPYDGSLVDAVSMASATDMDDAMARGFAAGFEDHAQSCPATSARRSCRTWFACCGNALMRLSRR